MYLKNFFIIAFTALIIVVCFSCKTSTEVGQINQLNVDFKKIDSLFNDAVIKEHIPGAVVYLSYKNEQFFNRAYGYQNIEDKVPMDTTSIFRLASMTKGLTAVAILQLVERGIISLEDPIKNYFPEFSNPEILIEVLPDSTFTSRPATKDITIRQLLTHTSGIGYGFQDSNYNALVIKHDVSEGFCQDNRTSFENTKRIASLPLLAEPGEKNIYSMSIDVLGTLIEKVSGLRYDDYIFKNILEPLRMDDSFFIIPKKQRHRLPVVYEPGEDNVGLIRASYEFVDYPIIETQQFFSGGSDLSATAKDYNNFLLAIENRGILNGNRILGEEFVEMMLSKQSILNEGDSYQGFAAWVVNEQGEKNGLRPKGSYDFGGFFDTYSWVDPKNDFTAILLLQMYPNNAHDIHWKFQQLVYENLN